MTPEVSCNAVKRYRPLRWILSARSHRYDRLIWIMVNFTVGYGAQYRTNHAVTSLQCAVRLVPPYSTTYTRVNVHTRRSNDGCGVRARQPLYVLTHTDRPGVIVEQIKPWDGSIRDEAIDFRTLEFPSISTVSCWFAKRAGTMPRKRSDTDRNYEGGRPVIGTINREEKNFNEIFSHININTARKCLGEGEASIEKWNNAFWIICNYIALPTFHTKRTETIEGDESVEWLAHKSDASSSVDCRDIENRVPFLLDVISKRKYESLL